MTAQSAVNRPLTVRKPRYPRASTLLIQPSQVFDQLTFFRDSVAAAGTALLLGAAAMSSPAGPRRGFCALRLESRAVVDPAQANHDRSVVAKRFAFEPARIEVTEGERMRLVVTSGDGVHGVEIKKFKVNKKVPRGGEPVTIEFVASARRRVPNSLLRILRRRPRRHEGYAGGCGEEGPIGVIMPTRPFCTSCSRC